MAEHNKLGKWGEEQAVRLLENKGYHVLEVDWTLGKRDLDVVAVDEECATLVFVEVKTRTKGEMMAPELAVDRRKMRNLAIAANAYVKLHPKGFRDVRFDIISIVGSMGNVKKIEHIEDAFNPLLIL